MRCRSAASSGSRKGLAFGFNYGLRMPDQRIRATTAATAIPRPARPAPTSRFRIRVQHDLDYGLCDHDVTNVFTGYINYDLPFGHDRMFARTLEQGRERGPGRLAGERHRLRCTAASQSPCWIGRATAARVRRSRVRIASRPRATPFKNFAGGGYIWFDPTTMADPAPGNLGNCPVLSERGPGLQADRPRPFADVQLTERQRMEFRFDAINAFNTPFFTVQGYQIDIFSNSYSLIGAGTTRSGTPAR